MKPLASVALFAALLLARWSAASAQNSPMPQTAADKSADKPLALADVLALGLAQNPALAQADLDVQIAQGRAVQAGLYPNPMLMAIGDEMGAGQGKQGGIITAPMMTQTIITAGKRKLDIAIANRKLDQAGLAAVRQRVELNIAVRQAFYDVLTARRRLATLTDLEKVAAQSVETTQKLLDAKQVAQLDLLQVQVENERILAEQEAAQREAAAAWRRLAATIGMPRLEEKVLAGDLAAPLPLFDYARSQDFLVENHPEVEYARVGIIQAELMLRRERAEVFPNVTVGAGYVRSNHDKMDEWMFQVSAPVPLWNRNQGNIQARRTEMGRSIREVERVQNDLTSRLATAHGNYAAAAARADRYAKKILPAARRAYEIAFAAFKGGQFEYLRVLQAQRAYQEATLEYVRALGEAWRAASEIQGLLLIEE
jgi:outer membrane protein, heavy metal efflux system